MDRNADNPIRRARKARGWTLKQMAAQAGVHVQALYLNECGCYPHILPDVLSCMVRELHVEPEDTEISYKRFVAGKRIDFANTHSLDRYSVANLGEPRIHPILALRDSLSLSRMGFAKGLCVQPTIMYNVENCLSKKLPTQLVCALKDAHFQECIIQELEIRYEEWCCG